jgi:RNA polymerase sigma factor (sigma-70 family)
VDDTDEGTHDQPDQQEKSRRFQQMALPHLDAAYNLARWLSGNPNDADDIVQEAYLRAFRFFDTFRGDSARPWLFAIVRRTWYTEWRRRVSAQEVALFDDAQHGDETFEGWSRGGEDPQTALIREEDVRLVHAALEKLPVEFREVLILRELEDMSYRDIAAIADLPVGTVMSRLARGRRRLAAALAALRGAGGGTARSQGFEPGWQEAAAGTGVRPAMPGATPQGDPAGPRDAADVWPHLRASTTPAAAQESPDGL